MKQTSAPYWVKQALRYTSQPEELITKAVLAYASNPAQCPIRFSGSTHELLNELYIEWRKTLRCVACCLYPTPTDLAAQLARLANAGPGTRAFDPGAGLGNLLMAAEALGSAPPRIRNPTLAAAFAERHTLPQHRPW